METLSRWTGRKATMHLSDVKSLNTAIPLVAENSIYSTYSGGGMVYVSPDHVTNNNSHASWGFAKSV